MIEPVNFHLIQRGKYFQFLIIKFPPCFVISTRGPNHGETFAKVGRTLFLPASHATRLVTCGGISHQSHLLFKAPVTVAGAGTWWMDVVPTYASKVKPG